MVVFRSQEHLAFTGQATPRRRMLNAIKVAFETKSQWIRRFLNQSIPSTNRPSRARREQFMQRRFALLTAQHPSTNMAVGVNVGVDVVLVHEANNTESVGQS